MCLGTPRKRAGRQLLVSEAAKAEDGLLHHMLMFLGAVVLGAIAILYREVVQDLRLVGWHGGADANAPAAEVALN